MDAGTVATGAGVDTTCALRARRSAPSGSSQLSKTLIYALFQPFKIGCRVHITGEAEICSAVVGEDGAVYAHQAADRHPGVPGHHLVTHEVERDLRARDVGADEVAQAEGKLAGNRSNIFPESVGQG